MKRREGPRPRTPSKRRDALEHDAVLSPLSSQSQSLSPTELTLFLYVLPRDPGAFVRACVCVGVCGRR